MRHAVTGVLVLILLPGAGWTGGILRGEESGALPLTALLELRHPRGAMEFSPDGKWLAYVVQGGRNSGLAHAGEILLLNTETRESRPLPITQGSSRLPAWSPDGRYLAFVLTQGPAPSTVWVWDTRSNEMRKVSDTPVKTSGPEQLIWLPDSRHMILTMQPAAPPPAKPLRTCDPSRENAGCAAPTATVYEGVTTATERDAWQADLDWARRDLVLLNVENGQANVLARDTMVGVFRVSADGSRIFFATPEAAEGPGSRQLFYAITEVKVQTSVARVIASGLRLEPGGRFSLSPTGTQLAYRVPGIGGGPTAVVVFDTVTRKQRTLGASPSGAVRQEPRADLVSGTSFTLLWSADGSRLFYLSAGILWLADVTTATAKPIVRIECHVITELTAEMGDVLSTVDGGNSTLVIAYDSAKKCDAFYRIDLSDGSATELLEEQSCYTCGAAPEARFLARSPAGGHLAYLAEDARHSAEIWMSDVRFERRERVTDFNGQIEKYRMGSMQVIDWLDGDGKLLHGALLLPADYQQGQRYPLVVFVYGGVSLSDAAMRFGGFFQELPYYNIQLLASRGYAVLMPDAPQDLGTPMRDLAKTVLPGVNKAIETGVADPDRLGIMGHSYGGYSVLSLLVETPRFKAAVLSDAYANLIGDYGEMEADGFAYGTLAETGQQLMGGSPWQYRDRYIENSPIFYLDRVQTPVLLAHGAEDDAIAPFLGDETFVALRRLGKVVCYVKYGGEAHWLLRPANQEDLFARLIRWFDEYVKGSDYGVMGRNAK
jgi:dipeptidyl aminopeptidase/acylaminoacyl peptidase